MSNSLIAQSDRINIQKETKQEIVKTLISYPIVLRELDINKELLSSCNNIRNIQFEELMIKDDKINNLLYQINLVEEQNKILNKQLNNKKLKNIGLSILSLGSIFYLIIK